MRIAICFSGFLRTGLETNENIKKFIGDLWKDCDFFMHTWTEDQRHPLWNEEWSHYLDVYPRGSRRLDAGTLKKFLRLYDIKKFQVENNGFVMDKVKHTYREHLDLKSPDWWIPLLYTWQKSVSLKKDYEKSNNFTYDYVIKMRPDIIFSEEISLKDVLNKVGLDSFAINQINLDSGNFTTDDIFFASTSEVADVVSEWWIDRIVTRDYLKKEKSSYSYFYDYILRKGFNPVNLEMYYLGNSMNTIGLYRKECLIFDPVKEFKQCVECDRIHYHQTELTHISPSEINLLRKLTLQERQYIPDSMRIRIAVCFSGMIRTGVEASRAIKSFIGENLYQYCDFFMHTWDISDSKQWHEDSIMSKQVSQREIISNNGRELADKLVLEYDSKFIGIAVETLDLEVNDLSLHPSVSPLWYSWAKSIELKQQYEESEKFKYDIVIKMRPDLMFHPARKLSNELAHFYNDTDKFYANGIIPARIDDVFFYSNSDIMDLASNFVYEIKSRPWTTNAFADYLKSKNINYSDTKDHVYTILREEALSNDITNFNICYNLDRKYYAPYDSDLLPE